MPRKKAPEEPTRAMLTPVQMASAIPRFEKRIADLEALDPSAVQERGDSRFRAVVDKIDDSLVQTFGHNTVEYHRYRINSLDSARINFWESVPIEEIREGYRRGIDKAIAKLRTIVEMLRENISEEADDAHISLPWSGEQTPGRRVFIVHGHDDAAKGQVYQFLTQLDLDSVVLHEQPNQGRTIIEKLESHGDVDFAVVLLTPDDIGFPEGKDTEAKARARQNVILELGFFLGRLGRNRVAALYKGEVDIPSDYSGVLYIEMDSRQGWKLELARELKQSGIEIDLNRALS